MMQAVSAVLRLPAWMLMVLAVVSLKSLVLVQRVLVMHVLVLLVLEMVMSAMLLLVVVIHCCHYVPEYCH